MNSSSPFSDDENLDLINKLIDLGLVKGKLELDDKFHTLHNLLSTLSIIDIKSQFVNDIFSYAHKNNLVFICVKIDPINSYLEGTESDYVAFKISEQQDYVGNTFYDTKTIEQLFFSFMHKVDIDEFLEVIKIFNDFYPKDTSAQEILEKMLDEQEFDIYNLTNIALQKSSINSALCEIKTNKESNKFKL